MGVQQGKYLLLVKIKTGTVTVEISVKGLQKARYRSTAGSNYTTLEHIFKNVKS